jgi:DNA-binding MarR family transcriptional regulator
VGEEAVTDLILALGRVERRVSRRLGDVLAAHGATVDEWRVLAVLAGGPGRPMRELAEAAAARAPKLTRIVDGMVAADLVERRVDAGDRRRILVSLTPLGRSRHRRLRPIVEAASASLEARVGTTETAELIRLLDRFLDRSDS